MRIKSPDDKLLLKTEPDKLLLLTEIEVLPAETLEVRYVRVFTSTLLPVIVPEPIKPT
jgi:hypothetical protein